MNLTDYQKYCIEHSQMHPIPAWTIQRTGSMNASGHEIAYLTTTGPKARITYSLPISFNSLSYTLYLYRMYGNKSTLVPHDQPQLISELTEVDRSLRLLADKVLINAEYDNYYGSLTVRSGFNGEIHEKSIRLLEYNSEPFLYSHISIPKRYYVCGIYELYSRAFSDKETNEAAVLRDLFTEMAKEVVTRDRNRLRTLKNVVSLSDVRSEKNLSEIMKKGDFDE